MRIENKQIRKMADRYKERGWSRFKASHQCTESECLFCNGWTWGAIDGYLAGYRAAIRAKRRTSKGKEVKP